jgi:hypothetical protein
MLPTTAMITKTLLNTDQEEDGDKQGGASMLVAGTAPSPHPESLVVEPAANTQAPNLFSTTPSISVMLTLHPTTPHLQPASRASHRSCHQDDAVGFGRQIRPRGGHG